MKQTASKDILLNRNRKRITDRGFVGAEILALVTLLIGLYAGTKLVQQAQETRKEAAVLSECSANSGVCCTTGCNGSTSSRFACSRSGETCCFGSCKPAPTTPPSSGTCTRPDYCVPLSENCDPGDVRGKGGTCQSGWICCADSGGPTSPPYVPPTPVTTIPQTRFTCHRCSTSYDYCFVDFESLDQCNTGLSGTITHTVNCGCRAVGKPLCPVGYPQGCLPTATPRPTLRPTEVWVPPSKTPTPRPPTSTPIPPTKPPSCNTGNCVYDCICLGNGVGECNAKCTPPTSTPTRIPTKKPTDIIVPPSKTPTSKPPTKTPTKKPTASPTPKCSGTCIPSGEYCYKQGSGNCSSGKICCSQLAKPTATPTKKATASPTKKVTKTPTKKPTEMIVPPSKTPTTKPTKTPTPKQSLTPTPKSVKTSTPTPTTYTCTSPNYCVATNLECDIGDVRGSGGSCPQGKICCRKSSVTSTGYVIRLSPTVPGAGKATDILVPPSRTPTTKPSPTATRISPSPSIQLQQQAFCSPAKTSLCQANQLVCLPNLTGGSCVSPTPPSGCITGSHRCLDNKTSQYCTSNHSWLNSTCGGSSSCNQQTGLCEATISLNPPIIRPTDIIVPPSRTPTSRPPTLTPITSYTCTLPNYCVTSNLECDIGDIRGSGGTCPSGKICCRKSTVTPTGYIIRLSPTVYSTTPFGGQEDIWVPPTRTLTPKMSLTPSPIQDDTSCRNLDGCWVLKSSVCIPYHEVNAGYICCGADEGPERYSYPHFEKGTHPSICTNIPTPTVTPIQDDTLCKNLDSCWVSHSGICILKHEVNAGYICCGADEGPERYPYPHFEKGTSPSICTNIPSPTVTPVEITKASSCSPTKTALCQAEGMVCQKTGTGETCIAPTPAGGCSTGQTRCKSETTSEYCVSQGKWVEALCGQGAYCNSSVGYCEARPETPPLGRGGPPGLCEPECTSSSYCEGKYGSNYYCKIIDSCNSFCEKKPQICTTGDYRCLGLKLQQCTNEGTTWQQKEICSSGTVCDPVFGKCQTQPAANIPPDKPQICEPECTDDQYCSVKYGTSYYCQKTDKDCFNRCVKREITVCTEGQKECAAFDTVAKSCSGNSWKYQACQTGYKCSQGECLPQPTPTISIQPFTGGGAAGLYDPVSGMAPSQTFGGTVATYGSDYSSPYAQGAGMYAGECQGPLGSCPEDLAIIAGGAALFGGSIMALPVVAPAIAPAVSTAFIYGTNLIASAPGWVLPVAEVAGTLPGAYYTYRCNQGDQQACVVGEELAINYFAGYTSYAWANAPATPQAGSLVRRWQDYIDEAASVMRLPSTGAEMSLGYGPQTLFNNVPDEIINSGQAISGAAFAEDRALNLINREYVSGGGQVVIIDPNKDIILSDYLDDAYAYLKQKRTSTFISRVDIAQEYVNRTFPGYNAPTATGRSTDYVQEMQQGIYSVGGGEAYLGQFIQGECAVCREQALTLHVVLADYGKKSEVVTGYLGAGGKHAWVEYIDSVTGQRMAADSVWNFVLPVEQAYKVYGGVERLKRQIFTEP